MINQWVDCKLKLINDSTDEGTKGLKKGFTIADQMLILMSKYSDDTFNRNTSSINSSEMNKAKKDTKRAAKCFKNMGVKQLQKVPHVANTDFITTPGEETFKVKEATIGNAEWLFSKVWVMIINS